MKMIGSIRNMAILKKLVAGLLIVVIPLFALSFIVNNIGLVRNREGICKLLINSLDSYNRMMETEFQRTSAVQKTTTVELALKLVNTVGSKKSDVDRMLMLLDFEKHLRYLQNTSWFNADARAYFPSLDYVLSISSSRHSGLSQDPEYRKMLEKASASQLCDIDGELFLIQPYINHSESPVEPEGVVLTAVQINKLSLSMLLNRVTNYKSGGTVLVSKDLSWYVSNRSKLEIISRLPDIINQTGSAGYSKFDNVIYIDINGVSYSVACSPSAVMNTYLITYARTDEVFVVLRVYWTFFFILSILSALIIGLFSYWIYRIIHKPLKLLVKSFQRANNGDLGFSIDYMMNDEFGYLYGSFNEMLQRLNHMIHEVYEQRIRSQHSELKRLQSQINPHFLFNNFFVLSRLISSKDIDSASRFSTYLGRYFQFITRNAADMISLETEVQHARTYTDICTVCYAGRIAIDFDEPPELLRPIMVPRLILQPIIENSYKYAFENKLSDAILKVRFKGQWENDTLCSFQIVIEDNGDEMSDAQLEALQRLLVSSDFSSDEYTGLYNVHRRILLKFGDGSGLQLLRGQMGGLSVKMVFNLRGDRKELPDESAIDCG